MRKQIFWFLDLLKGGDLKKDLTDISFINSAPKSEESLKRKKTYLNRLLNHAVNTTNFYRKYQNFESIEDFPVIDKNLIRDQYHDFQSDNSDFSKMRMVSTSGSTGTPFKIHHDTVKERRNYADTLYFSEFGGYEVGDPICYLRIWNEINRKSRLYQFTHNTHPIDVSDLSDKALKKIVYEINSLPDETVILAYGSTFEIMTDFLEKYNVEFTIQPRCCIVMSEPIHKKVRLHLSNLLQCPVLTRYSNSENGFIGHQWTMESEHYRINEASYHVELLDFEENIPVDIGKPGRVVVTDLFNHSVPVIRYDTGDIAIGGVEDVKGTAMSVFKSIEGRKLDYINNTSGELISPHTIDYAVRQTPGLIQFQLIQTENKEYVLKLLMREQINNDESAVIKGLKKYLGSDAEIKIKYVSEIPVLESGKRKIVVNSMKEQRSNII